MKRRLMLPMIALSACTAWAHPMGNFSVSHYSRIELTARGVNIRYVLDLAEIPTFQLLQEWKLQPESSREELEKRAQQQAREWARSLQVEAGGRALAPRLQRASLVLDKGAGGMPILRVVSELRVDAAPGPLRFEDRNFPDRAGWKEIVIVGQGDVAVDRATPNTPDRSSELTAYPQDPLSAPPQNLRASATWHSITPAVVTETAPAATPAGSSPAVPQQPPQETT